ncbi:hypothetical protein Nepgr_023434 [Nepenthes gracilis]|uniref:Uncharacterized protein n=1 Tax=Nepenthes gracilis TaxID=150966 RepID=A0AAD3T2I9_NEPGR|nr:hypothetical protein Nepgr_023434 [Nepenthes gracilis]
MGSCLSKCTPKKISREASSPSLPVQDKLVVSQTPNWLPPSTSSSSSSSLSSSSSSSSSSYSCRTGNVAASSSCSSQSSTSSCASSISDSKDRSFSNEFLLSCIKQNQHIIQVDDLIRIGLLTTLPTKDIDCRSKVQPSLPDKQHPSPQRLGGSAPPAHKRPRASSPQLTRQKSFRREPERPVNQYSISSLRSPSPSRMFINGGDVSKSQQERNCSKRFAGAKCNGANALQSHAKRENNREVLLRPPSPRSSSRRHHHKEAAINRVASKTAEITVGQVMAEQDVESMPMEDIDNPLIALDCFIFL